MNSNDDAPVKLAKHQSFKIERIRRSLILNAPYNPRTIDQYAKKKILANLKRIGLVSPLVVNKRTMHLVAGHQRLAMMDVAENADDYLLDVSMCELTDAEEREQNVFMNNPSAMGTWDVDALQELVLDEEIDFDFTLGGFEKVDLDLLIDMPDSIVGFEAASPEAQAHLDKAAEHADTLRGSRKDRPGLWDMDDVMGSRAKEAAGGPPGEPDGVVGGLDLEDEQAAPVEGAQGDDYEKEKADWREIRGDYVEKRKIKDDHRFFLMVVFDDAIQKQVFLETLKLPIDSEYVDGERLGADLGVFEPELPEGVYALYFNERGDQTDKHGNVEKTFEELEAESAAEVEA